MAANDGNGKAIPEKERQRKRNGSGRRTRTTQPGRKLNNVNFALSYFQRLMVRLVRAEQPLKKSELRQPAGKTFPHTSQGGAKEVGIGLPQVCVPSALPYRDPELLSTEDYARNNSLWARGIHVSVHQF